MRSKTAKTLRRASMTLEASYLVPWCVLITALLITLVFFVYAQVHYRTAALEAALAGNQYVVGIGGSGQDGSLRTGGEENPSGQLRARQTLQNRIADQPMPGGWPEWTVQSSVAATEVRMKGGELPAFQDMLSWSLSERVRRIRPAGPLRTQWVLQKLGQE